MKLRLSLLATIAFAMALALVGVLKDVNSTRANMPRPVQPFAAQSTGGISTNQLGQPIANNFTKTQALQGERVTLPWIYSGSGFQVDTSDGLGADVGSVWTNIDVNCDDGAEVDYMYDNCTTETPLRWTKVTTAVAGTDEEYLIQIMPPFPWILRHRTLIDHVCIPSGQVQSPSVLNTVYAQIPFSESVNGNQAFVAQTQLGGARDTPPSKICLDSPQSSESITTVYNNPPLENADTNDNDLDDASGLYARWTIFQSRGSSSLLLASDLRKSYQSPPSLPQDTGYVERIVQLECFWIDDTVCVDDDTLNGTSCDDDASGFLSPAESWDDEDLEALGGRDAVDEDNDCLTNAASVEPVLEAAGAIDAVDDDDGAASCDAHANWVAYSEQPMYDSHNQAEDQDCDGLVDGIEWFWGGADLVTEADGDNDGSPDFVEMFVFTDPTDSDTDDDGLLDKPDNNYIASAYVADSGDQLQCDNNWDDDGDAKINDGCPANGTAESGTACADDVDSDSDGDINDGCPIVATTAEGVNGEINEAANLDDNCPALANPDQLNSDAQRRQNGSKIANPYASNPGQDKLGDACDWDNDNDGATDAYENYVGTTDPLVFDEDGDTVNDGAELRLQLADPGTSDPADDSKKPAWTNVQQVYYRGCQINVNDATYPPFSEQDTNNDGVEMDIDGDGSVCPTDKDSDNGTGTGSAGPTEIADSVEAYGYNTLVANADTDGDLCPDWVEVMDINGDRTVGVGDQLRLAQRTAGLPALLGDPISDNIFNVNKDYDTAAGIPILGVGDDLAMAKNACDAKTGCAPCAAGEN